MMQYILPSICLLTAGLADGINQIIQFKYYSFKESFKKLNDNYWNPKQSWVNKYKDYNPILGARFTGSTTLLVFLTDMYHLSRFLEHFFLMAALVLCLGLNPEGWSLKLIIGASGWIVYRVGFVVLYSRF